MNAMLAAACVATMCAATVSVPSAGDAAVFRPDTFTLSNGLQVIVVHNRLSPAVSQMVWYKVGSVDDFQGKSGLAHYLEHLMFRGTAAVPAKDFTRIVSSWGGNSNAFTSNDFTAYHEVVAADRLAMVMWMEADRMRNLIITPEAAAPELDVVMSERDERTDNSPQGRFDEKMDAALFGGHPYGIPIIGKRHELETITPDDARSFYNRYYRPDNAVVVISGNVDTDRVIQLATATFGSVPVPADDGVFATRSSFPMPVASEANDAGTDVPQLIMEDAEVQQAHVDMRRIVPSSSTAVDDEKITYALEVLSEALGGGEASILYREMVRERGIAGGIQTRYDSVARGPAVFSILAVPSTDYSPRDLMMEINVSLFTLLDKGIPASEVKAARERLVRSAIFARDSLEVAGYVFGSSLTTGSNVRDVEEWPERIAAVTTADVNRALAAVVRSAHRLDGALVPKK